MYFFYKKMASKITSENLRFFIKAIFFNWDHFQDNYIQYWLCCQPDQGNQEKEFIFNFRRCKKYNKFYQKKMKKVHSSRLRGGKPNEQFHQIYDVYVGSALAKRRAKKNVRQVKQFTDVHEENHINTKEFRCMTAQNFKESNLNAKTQVLIQKSPNLMLNIETRDQKQAECQQVHIQETIINNSAQAEENYFIKSQLGVESLHNQNILIQQQQQQQYVQEKLPYSQQRKAQEHRQDPQQNSIIEDNIIQYNVQTHPSFSKEHGIPKKNPSNQSILQSVPQSKFYFGKTSIFQKIQSGCTLQCQLHRIKKGITGMTEFQIFIQKTKQLLLMVRKEGLWDYVFYIRQKVGSQYNYTKIATLESTFLSKKFTLIKQGQKFSNMTICYESNFMGLAGPRKMNIYLPKSEIPFKFLDECHDNLNYRKNMEKFKNKQPKWNEKEKSYILSFKGRARQSSIKNFVISDELGSQDKYFIIFGKQQGECFNLDIQSPFSLVQGIAVALTSFQNKVMCD